MLSQQSEQSDLDDIHSLLSLSSLEDVPNTFVHMSTPVFNPASDVVGNVPPILSPPPQPILSPPPPPATIYRPRANSLPASIPLCHDPSITLGPQPTPAKQGIVKSGPAPIPAHMPLLTAEKIFQTNARYINKEEIGRVAVKLARKTFFGESVLVQSSISGTENTKPLNPSVLQQMKTCIRSKFIEISPTEFESIWTKCIDSISLVCTYCRTHRQH